MTGRCKACQHFGAVSENGTTGQRGDVPDDWQLCGLAGSTYGSPDGSRALGLSLAIDAECYGADLLVSPEFGCVQFEGKS